MVALGCCSRRIVGMAALLVAVSVGGSTLAEDDKPAGDAESIRLGRELFEREWLPKDPRSPDGDGLGPLFNESSCVACHNQGGVGGAGSAARNVHLVFADTVGDLSPNDVEGFKTRLAKIHPSLHPGKSLIVHRFSTSPSYLTLRNRLDGAPSIPLLAFAQGFGLSLQPSKPERPSRLDAEGKKLIDSLRAQVEASAKKLDNVILDDGVQLALTQRNTPALFGAGLLDAIPDHVILAAEKSRDKRWPAVKGIAPRDAKGKVNRFGWKGEIRSLRDFVTRACAQELGLHLGSEAQPIDPENPYYESPGPDMTSDDIDQLTTFVASLPRPREREAGAIFVEKSVDAGRNRFYDVGCGDCHRPNLGDVRNVYTDLLLHDMGSQLVDQGRYGQFLSEQVASNPAKKAKKKTKEVVASSVQWRTPPLWGVRDSAPYMHDGRANTIEQAIALHGGEAEASVHAYFSLTNEQRGELQTFLKTLVAP